MPRHLLRLGEGHDACLLGRLHLARPRSKAQAQHALRHPHHNASQPPVALDEIQPRVGRRPKLAAAHAGHRAAHQVAFLAACARELAPARERARLRTVEHVPRGALELVVLLVPRPQMLPRQRARAVHGGGAAVVAARVAMVEKAAPRVEAQRGQPVANARGKGDQPPAHVRRLLHGRHPPVPGHEQQAVGEATQGAPQLCLLIALLVALAEPPVHGAAQQQHALVAADAQADAHEELALAHGLPPRVEHREGERVHHAPQHLARHLLQSVVLLGSGLPRAQRRRDRAHREAAHAEQRRSPVLRELLDQGEPGEEARRQLGVHHPAQRLVDLVPVRLGLAVARAPRGEQMAQPREPHRVDDHHAEPDVRRRVRAPRHEHGLAHDAAVVGGEHKGLAPVLSSLCVAAAPDAPGVLERHRPVVLGAAAKEQARRPLHEVEVAPPGKDHNGQPQAPVRQRRDDLFLVEVTLAVGDTEGEPVLLQRVAGGDARTLVHRPALVAHQAGPFHEALLAQPLLPVRDRIHPAGKRPLEDPLRVGALGGQRVPRSEHDGAQAEARVGLRLLRRHACPVEAERRPEVLGL